MARGDMRSGQDGYINSRFNTMAEFDPLKNQSDFVKQLAKKYDKAYKLHKDFIEKAQKLEQGAVLDIEKTKSQLRKEALEEHKKQLRAEAEFANTLEEQKAAKQELLSIKSAEKFGEALDKTVSKISGVFSKSINDYLGAFSEYTSKINTRLQGTTNTYKNISKGISRDLTMNPFVKQSDVYKNLSTLVEQGIAYNVEQRSFLQTIKEKIADTFDATNGTLVRLIKIQQADTTAARLGLESNLNKFLNNVFKDSSYLNGLSDSVAAAIISANSQLSKSQSVAFESTVQSWLGSLSSVGVGDNTIQALAQGINYLGSGNINALNGSEGLQNLLVMAASRAGLDYSKMLSGGLTPRDANTLLQSIVTFAQEIGQTNNLVVKSQYANLFGMTIEDLTAIMNLSSKDLVSISNNMLTYSESIAETERSLKASNLLSRTSMAEMVENFFDNVMTGIGENISNDFILYSTWLINDIVEQATGGINIPFVNAFGTGVDLNANVNQLIKLGIVGAGAIGEMMGALSLMSTSKGFSLWDIDSSDVITHGDGFAKVTDSSIRSTTSQSMYIGSNDEGAMYKSSVTSAMDNVDMTVHGQENNLEEVIKDSIAPDVHSILGVLDDMRSMLYDRLDNGVFDNYNLPSKVF